MTFATEQNFKPIPEYPDFDASRHVYSVESGGGDGWLAHQPLMDALDRDLQNVIDDDTLSLVELGDLEAGEWPGWINALYVFENGREANGIAEFDLATWQWLQIPVETIKAKVLYDLRAMTNFCSPVDLHNFFHLIGENFAPGSETEISRERIMGHPIGQQALLLLQLPLADSLDIIMEYRQ